MARWRTGQRDVAPFARKRRPVAVIGPPRQTPSGLTDAALVSTLRVRGVSYMQALQQADERRRVALWGEIGDALALAGRLDRARMAWERGLAVAQGRQALRAEVSSIYWRLGQLCEGTRQLDEAMSWYERAADAFRRGGALADEATARMALARAAYHLSGGGEARRHVREAVLAAREADEASRSAGMGESERISDIALLGEALEMSGEVALDLGHFDEAVSALRESVRQHERARLAGGGETRSSEEVRATVALADALLEARELLQAVTTYESVEALIDSHELPETRGRGQAILGLVNLELGKVAEATEPLKRAHEWYTMAGSTLRRARLHASTARRVESLAGPDEARAHYEKAWALAQTSQDELRLAPIGYALARCYLKLGDWVRADEVIEKSLTLVQNHGDLEGLERCTELAVRIAIKLAQGRLALDRLLLLARTRGRLGDRAGEARSLKSALLASVAVPGLEPAPVARELMECLHQVGTDALGPAEVDETAEAFEKAELFDLAGELAALEAERHLAAGRTSEAAHTLTRAAVMAIRAGDRWAAVDLWDRAIGLGRSIGLPEVEQWEIERTIASEG